jgi:hypothetical protein
MFVPGPCDTSLKVLSSFQEIPCFSGRQVWWQEAVKFASYRRRKYLSALCRNC